MTFTKVERIDMAPVFDAVQAAPITRSERRDAFAAVRGLQRCGFPFHSEDDEAVLAFLFELELLGALCPELDGVLSQVQVVRRTPE